MTLWSEQRCALQRLVNLNFGLRPKLSRLVSVFGLSERLIQKVKWPIMCPLKWPAVFLAIHSHLLLCTLTQRRWLICCILNPSHPLPCRCVQAGELATLKAINVSTASSNTLQVPPRPSTRTSWNRPPRKKYLVILAVIIFGWSFRPRVRYINPSADFRLRSYPCTTDQFLSH